MDSQGLVIAAKVHEANFLPLLVCDGTVERRVQHVGLVAIVQAIAHELVGCLTLLSQMDIVPAAVI